MSVFHSFIQLGSPGSFLKRKVGLLVLLLGGYLGASETPAAQKIRAGGWCGGELIPNPIRTDRLARSGLVLDLPQQKKIVNILIRRQRLITIFVTVLYIFVIYKRFCLHLNY